MKALTCEMCGSTNLMKDEGVFICQSCGTKYSKEEAKKMMIDGTVEVAGTIKVDTSSELTNLYEIARRAKNDNNSENALKYYDMILIKDPSSWEANFYVVYFRAMSCKIMEIGNAAVSVSNCLDSTLNLVKNNVVDVKKQGETIAELCSRLLVVSTTLYSGAKNHYLNHSSADGSGQEYNHRTISSAHILYTFGDCLINNFEDTYGLIAAEAWKQGIIIHNDDFLTRKEADKNTIIKYAEKVKKYDSSYETPEVSTSACYIATAVYGSYNCSEVWTLRRFRDETLAKTWYGRAFIKTYYAISPTTVKWFGETKWFKNVWRRLLDKFVSKLNNKGVENTPYQDN